MRWSRALGMDQALGRTGDGRHADRFGATFRRLLRELTGATAEDVHRVPAHVTFLCNVCGQRSTVEREQLGRETPSCPRCQSTVRMRGIVHVLSTVLFGRSLPLALFPHRPHLRGLGMSDWVGYAHGLAAKLDYLNTYYHREPRFDVTAPPPAAAASFDFLVSSDVFEHVAPPIDRAFANARDLLRPGGHLVFTVPYVLTGETVEHFPELHEYELLDFRGTRILVNRTRAGRLQVFENLCFHGGEGDTLEMRQFARATLVRQLAAAGFTDIRFWGESYLAYGIYWPSPLSLPITARRPA